MPKKHQHSESKNHQPHEVNSNKKKKKISLFYKFNFSILLLASLLLAYFLILVSIEPKSMPLVTKKIEEVLQEKLRTDVSLDQSYVSFTRYGTLKVVATNLKILYSFTNNAEKQSFIIPKLETEFSLLKIFLLRFEPISIKVVNPTIMLDDLRKFKQNSDNQNLIIKFLSSIRTGDFPIENFEIESALILAKGQNFDTEILLKKSQIRTSFKDKTLLISSSNKLNFDETGSDVDLNANCQLSENDGLKCDVILENFVANSVADLHPDLEILNRVNATLKITTSFVAKNGKMGDVLFKAESKNGDFNFPDFFSGKIDFSDFSASGKYDSAAESLNLFEIKTYLAENSKIFERKPLAPLLEMSLLISQVKNLQNQKLDFDIKLQNASLDDLEKFWPSALNQAGVRQWVISHVKGGVLKDSKSKFSLTKNDAEFFLNDIEAQLNFEGANLNYDPEFPEVKNISGHAVFSKKDMKITLSAGEVLNSKISEALIEIEDFEAPTSLLKISGKSQGTASDSLKHIDHKSSKFITEVEKYLNGNSQNDFDIRLPLQEKIDLKDVYIAVNSSIQSLKNDYLKGDVAIHSKKDFASTNFFTNVDLTAAELSVQPLDISKKTGINSGLSLVLSIKNPQKIRISDIELWKKETNEGKKNSAKIAGVIEFETAPFLVTSLDLKNSNFGKNNYVFSYKADKKTATQKIFVKAAQLNFAPFIEQKFFNNSSANKDFSNLQIQVAANNLSLLRNKSIKNFYLTLNCKNAFCANGLIKGNYNKAQSIDLHSTKNAKENFGVIEGKIADIGYLAEALGISNTISAGNAQVKLQNKLVNKKQVLEGLVTIDDEITFYENPAVKRLAKNDLFSQVKDKIFSNDKTTFNSVKIEFALQENVLELKSLIANNFKIGITAKGTIDLKNDIYAIKGMIIPGFIVNNLFGIGKIPILGNVVGLLTGGEGGGLFGIRYEYTRKKGDKEATFETHKVSSFVPTTIKSLFDLI